MAGALIGALRVSLSAETTAFEAGMTRAQATAKRTAANLNTSFKGTAGALNSLKAGVAGFVGALSVGAIIAAGKASLEYAGHLGELADTLGLTTKDLQTFRYAAGQVGISQDELENGIQKLTISMGKAQVGSEAQAKAFNAIGISLDQIKGKNAGDVFRLIAEKLENVSDRSKRAAVEVALFGKAGAKLDNLLSGSQGRLDELSKAAEKLGIVLSDEQIRNADRTADKLAALQTVLKANIASAVSDNAEGIFELVNALGHLVAVIPKAIQGWSLFLRFGGTAFGAISRGFNPITAVQNAVAGRNNDLLASRFAGDRAAGSVKLGGGDVKDFLAPAGKKDHSADELQRKQLEALQKAYEFQRSELDAQKDILDAKRDLATDYVEQTTLSIDILNLERQSYQADLDNQVAQNKITKGKQGISEAQAQQLLAAYDIADGYKRQKLLQDEDEQRQRDVATLEEHDFDRKKESLEKLADIATTQSERRQIELDILKLAYEEKKAALQRIIDNSKDEAAKEDARRDLLTLNKNYAADKQGVINSTRNPIEEWAASVPKSAAEINEALQSIEAQGIQGLSEALTGVITGTESLKSAFHNLAASILSDLIQMTIKMLLFKALQASFGGGTGGFAAGGAVEGHASGGFVSGPGSGKSDSIPAMLSNGEYVISAAAVKKMGTQFFDNVNAGRMPHKKGGGILGALKFLSPAAFLHSQNALRFISPFAFGVSQFASGGLVRGLSLAKTSYGAAVNIGNDSSRAPTFNMPINIDATGADPAGLARVESSLDQLRAELPGKVVEYYTDARQRFVIRK